MSDDFGREQIGKATGRERELVAVVVATCGVKSWDGFICDRELEDGRCVLHPYVVGRDA